ncbi:MAG: amidase [Alphaproteobacteria bacterium]|jgi:aspartyl-tRNA(Asn)/glutamyl-tRNA(Gln) amidotransferase subunit A|nr:amidase [Alphaproteobacteria bacterium]
MSTTIADAVEALASGQTTSAALTEAALDAIDSPSGEGGRAFLRVYHDAARATARASDTARDNGVQGGPLAGIAISVKDLFDVAGEITLAGSKVRDQSAPAAADAPIVARLRAAGAVIVGRTNMTEFAFSGLGINPHYDTPRNPWDRETGRVPGGSSSGAAVSVTDGMAIAAIGTDTGGSVRIPVALCGLTGFKPTARRVPTAGAFPLSTTLDSIGPLANSVACCAILDQIMSGAAVQPLVARPASTLTLAVPQTIVLDEMDDLVAGAFQNALSRLSAAGARIVEIPFDVTSEIFAANATGGFAAPEAFATLRDLLEVNEDRFDPRVSVRVKRGAAMSAADYIVLLEDRAAIQAKANAASRDFDALLMPTTPIVAPPITELSASNEAYHGANMLMLRNPSFGNFLDRCGTSLPIHRAGDAPVGMMVMGETMGDAKTLEVSAGIEAALAG